MNRRPARTSGLTLVEIMITVAILALLVAVFLLYLRPDDDRRCKLEAQRLAAYMLSAEANSVMRDGPVRVAISFAKNTGTREFRKSGAALSDLNWELDKKAEEHTVGSPVKIESVQTPLGGMVKSGQAWMNFNGPRTPGGVTVLALNEAAYSVVVPPQGQGEVKVLKGRQNLKDPKLFKRGSLSDVPTVALNDAPGLSGGGGLPPIAPRGGSRLSGGGAGTSNPPVADAPEINPNPEAPPPALNPEAPPPVINEPPPPAQQPEDDPEPEEEPEEDPEEEPECRTKADCLATMGPRAECVGTSAGGPNVQDPMQNRCRMNLSGVGFRVVRARVTQPDGFDLMTSVVNNFITAGKLNLTVYMETLLQWTPDNQGGYEAQYRAWSFNGLTNTGTVQQPNPDFPTTRSTSRVAACGQGFVSCHDIISEDQTAEGLSSRLAIWLPVAGPDADQCPHQLLEIAGTLNVNMTAQGEAHVRLTGIITPKAAREMEIKLPGLPTQRLQTLLENSGAQPDSDTNGDGRNDAWTLSFEGPAATVSVTGNLYGSAENNPCAEYEDN